MTDTLKPAELDLEALKKVALEATPGPWTLDEEWIQYEGMLRPSHNIYSAAPSPDGRIICNVDIWRHDPEGTHENARHIATFSPATVLSLLTRIEALEAERDEARARLRNVPGLTPFNDAEDAAWPLAMARLQNTEPGPDQGIAMVGTGDLELALRRLSQFADVALRNAAVIGGLEARALSAEAQRDRMREALERAVAWFRDYARQHRLKGTQDGMLKADTNDERADYCEAALSQGSGEEG
jgi:hypothetical protein